MDKEDHRAALNPSRPGVHGMQKGAQNVMTSPSGFEHGEDPASRNGSSAASGGQGTRGGHGDPSRENARENHDDPKTHCALQDVQVCTDTKAANAEMPRH